MTSVITGDIINSRQAVSQKGWLAELKKCLAEYGQTPKTWEIFRGDSFQLEIVKPENSLLAALFIKASMKRHKGLDVRMGIGIGKKTYNAARVSESNGPAFIYSGEAFESLNKVRQTLAIRSPWTKVDSELNLMISLASIAMDKWSVSSAELVRLSIQNQELSQAELGKKLKRTQSSVSERQSRAHYSEIMEMEAFFREKIMLQTK